MASLVLILHWSLGGEEKREGECFLYKFALG